MSTIYQDPRRAVVSITMKKGGCVSMWTFRSGKPLETFASIVVAMLDGYELDGYKTVPLHEIENHERHT